MLALFLANPPPYQLCLQPSGALPDGPTSSSQEPPPAASDGVGDGEADGPAAAAEAAAGEEEGEEHTPARRSRAGTSAKGGKSGGTSSGSANGRASSAAPRGGTLVVCPPALLQQWQAEAANHAHGALTVEVYDGLRGLGNAFDAPLRGGGSGGGGGGSGQKQKQKRQKPAQREMELYARLLAGEEIEASFDAEAEAAAALRRLQAADVVLTSFDVLRAEVGNTGVEAGQELGC